MSPLLQAFVIGLSLGPVCLFHCGLFHTGFLARNIQERRAHDLLVAGALFTGRFAAYAAVGLAAGLLAGRDIFLLRHDVLRAVLGVLMLAYAVLPRRKHSRWLPCRGHVRGAVFGAFGIGILTGLAPCPPFLASVVVALQAHGPASAMLVMIAFFAGASVYLVPVWLAPLAVSSRWRPRLRTAGRFVAGGVAAYALLPLLAGAWIWGGGSPTHAAADIPSTELSEAALRADADGQADDRAAGTKKDRSSAAVDVPPTAPADVRPIHPKQFSTKTFTERLVRKLDLSLKEASYYETLAGGRVKCHLCPRECALDEGQRGICGVRVNLGGRLRSMVYARPVSIHIDPVEKKPLFHMLPGSRALSVATVGCNLGCIFCQNYEISQALPEEVRRYRVGPEKLVEAAVKRKCEGIAYTYTEPTVFFEYMRDTARLASKKGIKNYWITCGQIQAEPLKELCTYIDAANVDLKGFRDTFYVKYCNARLAPVLRSLKILDKQGVHVEVTNLVIPGANDDPEMIRSMCRWIVHELGADTPVHFSRFHPAYKMTRTPATPLDTLKTARSIAGEEGLHYVYIGNVRMKGAEDTICPECGKTVIERTGFFVHANHIKNGKCETCGAPVAGVWTGGQSAKTNTDTPERTSP